VAEERGDHGRIGAALPNGSQEPDQPRAPREAQPAVAPAHRAGACAFAMHQLAAGAGTETGVRRLDLI